MLRDITTIDIIKYNINNYITNLDISVMQIENKNKYMAPTSDRPNIFKNGNNNNNIMQNTIIKKQNSRVYTHKESEFPELSVQKLPTLQTQPPSNSESDTSKSQINYKTVANYKPEEEIGLEKEKIISGWMYISSDNKRNDKCVYKPCIQSYNEELSFNEESHIVFNQLVSNWEKYKDDYIEVYGYEMYESMYLMPHFEYDDNDDTDYEEEYDCEDSDDYYDDYYGPSSNKSKFDSV